MDENQSVQQQERNKIIELINRISLQGNSDQWFDCCDAIIKAISSQKDE